MKRLILALMLVLPLAAYTDEPTRLAKPLRFVPADSVALYDFYWSAFADSARKFFPEAKPYTIEAQRMSDKKWAKALEEWKKFVSDSINLVGGTGDEERELQTFSAINTIHSTAPLYLASGDAHYFEAIDYALQNGVRGGLSHSDPPQARMAAAVEALSATGYFAATSDSALYLNLFAECEFTARVGKRDVHVEMHASYPWTGLIKAKINVLSEDKRLKIYVRIPEWASGKVLMSERYETMPARYRSMISVGDIQQRMKIKNGYVLVEREWTEDDNVLVIEYAMPVHHIRSKADTSKLAIKRGPLVYAFTAPTAGKSYDPTSTIRFIFDNKVRQSFILHGTFSNPNSSHPNPSEKATTPFQMAPYYVMHEESPKRVQVFVHSGN